LTLVTLRCWELLYIISPPSGFQFSVHDDELLSKLVTLSTR